MDLRTRLLMLTLLPTAAVALAACSSNGSSATSTTTTAASAPRTTTTAASHPVVTTASVDSLGKILVNDDGQVLYTFTDNGAPVPCSASCLAAWPPVTLPAGVSTPTGGPGVGTLGTTRTNGVTQVTVNGLPLFTYAGDPAPGVANGNNLVSFGGTWKVVKAS